MSHTGTVLFRGYRVWYRITGERDEPGKHPLLVLHGGPGAAHDYLESLEAMAATGRRVVFYDQLGVGNSDHPKDPSLWSISLFLEELEAIRRELCLAQVHILGQSWGGMLGMEYALTKPLGLVSLVVANSPASMLQWAAEANRLRSELPYDVQETLHRHEQAGTTDHPDYQNAMMVYYRKHVCRLDPWPECLNRSLEKMGRHPEVYHTMNGPSEFHVTGKLKGWDIIHRLGDIQIPVLVISGRYDEATPLIAKTVHQGIPSAQWVLFEESSHMPHLEETERYLQVLENFLDRVERLEFQNR